jgi:hypothetical protein
MMEVHSRRVIIRLFADMLANLGPGVGMPGLDMAGDVAFELGVW